MKKKIDANPLISCIIPTFNRRQLLKEAIESVLNQTYDNWELIIIDDQSTDNTKEMVESYIKKDKRIKYYLNPKKGGNAARNYGIMKAKGEYIAFLDDDDISLQHRFSSQIRVALKYNSKFIVSGYQVSKRSDSKTVKLVRTELRAKSAGFPSRWLIGKDIIYKAGFFDENMPAMQDNEFSYRLANFENYVLHDDIVSRIYHTEASLSKASNKTISARKMILIKHRNNMNPIEASWWYYTIGIDYLNLKKYDKAKIYLKLSTKWDSRFCSKIVIFLFNLLYFNIENMFFRKVAVKMLNYINNLCFPKIVFHRIVK